MEQCPSAVHSHEAPMAVTRENRSESKDNINTMEAISYCKEEGKMKKQWEKKN